MSELDKALDRLGEAVASLITASDQGRSASSTEAKLTVERDKLQAEVDNLRALREDDATLRAEAAVAVKAALKDLRGLVAAQGAAKKNAG
jgi:hypothetical protein